MAQILVVEDELVIRAELRRLLARQGHDVAEAGSVREAETEHHLDRFDLVLADVRLPGALGTELVGKAPGVPVLLMTSYATVRSAVDAMKCGAADYIAKPFDHDELLALIDRLVAGPRQGRPAAPAKGIAPPPSDPAELAGMVGASPQMRAVAARVRKVAPTDATVLVLGESGTGKEIVAHAIHRLSPRADRHFVPVNCAAIPDGLIESELFGHERGAFTGAMTAHVGLVEAAHQGTLFLDEIGELPLAAQARLLRFLQTGEVRPVGATRPREVSVRLVAATHRDLPAMVETGTFRKDLFFRLRVIEVKLPRLRDRDGDALHVARRFLSRHAERSGEPLFCLGAAAEQAILAHPWPGNVRELENAIERAIVLCEGGEITPDLLGLGEGSDVYAPDAPSAPRSAPETAQAAPRSDPAASPPASSDTLEEYFRRFVLLHQAELSETELARRLGISRKTLWERRQRLGLARPR